jgi:hypothetical protein
MRKCQTVLWPIDNTRRDGIHSHEADRRQLTERTRQVGHGAGSRNSAATELKLGADAFTGGRLAPRAMAFSSFFNAPCD